MNERIQCPECVRRHGSNLPLRWALNCSTCGEPETHQGTIPDRRKVSRGINSYCCFCHSYHVPGEPHVRAYPDVDRRKPTANDRAVERIKAYCIGQTTPSGFDRDMPGVGAVVLRIIREEAERE